MLARPLILIKILDMSRELKHVRLLYSEGIRAAPTVEPLTVSEWMQIVELPITSD